MSTLIDDVRSLLHLYGQVPKETIADILNKITEHEVDAESIDSLIDESALERHGIYVIDGDYVLNRFHQLNYDEVFLKKKERQPYYMPLGYDLEYYQDEYYHEPTQAYDELLAFLKTCYRRKKKAEKVCSGIQYHCRASKRLENLPPYLNQQKLKIRPEESDQLETLILNLVQQTRMYDLNGHTPNELGWKVDVDMAF